MLEYIIGSLVCCFLLLPSPSWRSLTMEKVPGIFFCPPRKGRLSKDFAEPLDFRRQLSTSVRVCPDIFGNWASSSWNDCLCFPPFQSTRSGSAESDFDSALWRRSPASGQTPSRRNWKERVIHITYSEFCATSLCLPLWWETITRNFRPIDSCWLLRPTCLFSRSLTSIQHFSLYRRCRFKRHHFDNNFKDKTRNKGVFENPSMVLFNIKLFHLFYIGEASL